MPLPNADLRELQTVGDTNGRAATRLLQRLETSRGPTGGIRAPAVPLTARGEGAGACEARADAREAEPAGDRNDAGHIFSRAIAQLTVRIISPAERPSVGSDTTRVGRRDVDRR